MSGFDYEKLAWDMGFRLIAGVDEVGRGPPAGPVVCCAAIMPLDEPIDGVDDSKKLSAKKRELLAEEIKKRAIACSIFQVESDEIDRINILNAVKKCMTGAVEGLSVRPDIVLVDGLDIGLPFQAKYIAKGDALSYTIGCASIVAKVYRDRLMEEYAAVYPAYGFEQHKGYGTKRHIEAIREVGPCAITRRTFIRNFWDGRENA